MKELSVVIVTYNSEPDIYGCLEALYAKNDLGEQLEVIVVDNSSRSFDHLQKELTRLYGDRVQVLRNTQNGGYGQGNNIGIRHSSAPIVMIMNPDVRLKEFSLKAVVARYRQDERLAICGFKQVINEQGKAGQSFSLLNHYPGWIRLIGNGLAKRLDCFCGRHMYFSGACFCVRKQTFEQAGLFDEQIFLYGEENDIHYRIRQAVPRSHDGYMRTMTYLHPTEDRPTTDRQYQLRLQSNEYVMAKQGRQPGTYIRSEEQRLRWAKRLTRR